jgi:pyruvate/2-oxoglutarate/acetoin dehydrogenase E1 component
MHAFFTPFGIYPNNAIVGGSGSIAPGAALFKRVNRKPGIVVCNIGDASFSCGPVWEGITFAAMDQYRKLWDQALGGGLPIIFNCMDNFYGMGGQPWGETMGCEFIARIGAGVNPDQMHAERVNGYDPLPVADAFLRKTEDPGGGARPGSARHHHLPHQRPLALRRLQLPQENPRVRQIAGKSRSGIGADGKPLPKAKCVALRDALFEAIFAAFQKDPTLVAYGEENRDWGGAFAVYRGLTEALPYHRLFNTPISEGAIVGSAVGYALEGGRALVELMYCDFMGRAGDEIFNQLAKWQSMSGGLLRMPVVLRVSVGSKYGAQHSQDWSAMVAHIPGLKVVFPATPYDAKGLLASALVGTDPVVFFESQRIYDVPELFHPGGVPEEWYEIPFGVPDVKRRGEDVTILTIGATLYRALEAADRLEREFGLSAEVIDARSIVPFDYEPVLESVRKTRKIVLASDACERGQRAAHHGVEDHPAGVRRAGRPADRRGSAELDHAARRAGGGVLPVPVGHPGRDPHAPQASARVPPAEGLRRRRDSGSEQSRPVAIARGGRPGSRGGASRRGRTSPAGDADSRPA